MMTDERLEKVLHDTRKALAGMIEAVRSVEIDQKEWDEFVGAPLSRAYDAIKLRSAEIAALAKEGKL